MSKQKDSFGNDIEDIPGIKKASEIQAVDNDPLMHVEYDKHLYEAIYASEILNTKRLEHVADDFKCLRKASTKTNWAIRVAALLSNQELFDLYFDSLPVERQKLLIKVAFSSVLTLEEAYSGIDLKIPDYMSDVYSYWGSFSSSKNKEHFPYLFAVNFLFIKIDVEVKYALRRRLSDKKPEHFIDIEQFHQMKNLFSEEKGMEVFENLHEIIMIAYNSGYFDREVNQPVLKKVYDQINEAFHLSQFYSGTEEKDVSKVKNLRIELLLKFLSVVLCSDDGEEIDFSALPEDPLDLIKKLFEIFISKCNYEFDGKYLVPFSLSQANFYGGYFVERVADMQSFIKFLKTYNPDKVYEFNDFYDSKDLTNISFMPCYDNFYKFQHIDKYCCKERHTVTNLESFSYFIARRSVINFILIMSSLGFFEIAYDIPDFSKNDRSEMNEALYYKFGKPSYLKFTELGKAVFGISEHFEYKAKNAVEPPKLYADDLVISVNNDDKITPVFIGKWSKKLSDNIYIVEKQKLLRQFNTREEIIEVFGRLESISKAELPELWKGFKSLLLESYIHIPSSDNYCIFDLKDQKMEVLKIVKSMASNDYIILMDKQKVAVKKGYVQIFINALESKGFKMY